MRNNNLFANCFGALSVSRERKKKQNTTAVAVISIVIVVGVFPRFDLFYDLFALILRFLKQFPHFHAFSSLPRGMSNPKIWSGTFPAVSNPKIHTGTDTQGPITLCTRASTELNIFLYALQNTLKGRCHSESRTTHLRRCVPLLKTRTPDAWTTTNHGFLKYNASNSTESGFIKNSARNNYLFSHWKPVENRFPLRYSCECVLKLSKTKHCWMAIPCPGASINKILTSFLHQHHFLADGMSNPWHVSFPYC